MDVIDRQPIIDFNEKDRKFTYALFQTLGKCPKFVSTFIRGEYATGEVQLYTGEMTSWSYFSTDGKLTKFEDLIDNPELLDTVYYCDNPVWDTIRHDNGNFAKKYQHRWPWWDRYTTADRIAAVEWFYGDSCADERQHFIDAGLNVSGQSSWCWIHRPVSDYTASRVHSMWKRFNDSTYVRTYQAFITPVVEHVATSVNGSVKCGFANISNTNRFFDQNLFSLIDDLRKTSYGDQFEQYGVPSFCHSISGSHRFTNDGVLYTAYGEKDSARQRVELILAIWKAYHVDCPAEVPIEFFKDSDSRPYGQILAIGEKAIEIAKSRLKSSSKTSGECCTYVHKAEYQKLEYTFDIDIINAAITEFRNSHKP